MTTTFDLWSRYVAKTARPILVGPWREEIGSEVSYWLPWVKAWQAQYHIPDRRLVAISRGGASVWYGAGTSVELTDYWPLEALRLETQRAQATRQSVKQQTITPAERVLYPVIAHRLGLRRYHVLHPHAMYRALSGWWADRLSLSAVSAQLRYSPLPTPHLPLSVTLPEQFACVRFYQRATWPFTEEVRDYCTQLVGNLAKVLPVVVLGSGAHHDDHLDLNFQGPNVTSLVDAFPLRDNLACQSAVIAKSRFFVGTYGGTMQLAVRLRKPSVGFYLKWGGTAYAHKVLTEYLALSQGTPLWIGTPQEGELMRTVISGPLEIPAVPGSSSSAMGQ